MRSLTKINDKNLNERLDSATRANEKAVNEQSAMLGQVKNILDEHTKSLEAQGTASTRLNEQV